MGMVQVATETTPRNNHTLYFVFDPYDPGTYATLPLLGMVEEYFETNLAIRLLGAYEFDNVELSREQKKHLREQLDALIPISRLHMSEDLLRRLDSDDRMVFNSAPPTACVLAVQSRSRYALSSLRAVQEAFFARGDDISKRWVLERIGPCFGLSDPEYDRAYTRALEPEAIEHSKTQTQRLLESVGATGAPQVIAKSGSHVSAFELTPYFGKPKTFAETLGAVLRLERPIDF
jgi:putative protein-disulfide isomerase